MKKIFSVFMIAGACFFMSCNSATETKSDTPSEPSQALTGQSGVQDDESARNVVQVAISSPDHTTL
jgi:hypothetical protein